jgi:DNA repair photolyase
MVFLLMRSRVYARLRQSDVEVSDMTDSAGPRKGRGAVSNPSGRFARDVREAAAPEDQNDWDELTPAPRTVVRDRPARSIVSHNASPDIPFSRSINPYAGCEHGCVYCYARPSHAYYDLSPGLDFETQIFAKPNAAELLRQEFSRPGYRCELIVIGANTDPYQPIERDRALTRQLLEVMLEFKHPVGITTKSALVERDIDILAPLAELGLVEVFMSIGTLDGDIARTLEPRASAPYRRIKAIERLSGAGIPTGVLVAPIIPFLNDQDIESILSQAAQAGACDAGYVVIACPLRSKTCLGNG